MEDHEVGRALRRFRREAGWTLRETADRSGVSEAMVSRIENGQVSPSLASLGALADALGLPLVNLFLHTADTRDITHVKAGEGLKSVRIRGAHRHDFRLLGYHKRSDVAFEPLMVTLRRADSAGEIPKYHQSGCEFIHVLEGEAIYAYGDERFHLKPGDSLSFDAAPRHGFQTILTPLVRFVSVAARRAEG